MNDQDYTSYHGKVAEVNTALTQMSKLCGQLELEESRKAIEASRHKLTSHKFSVGIMGEFKRGKSTVINALLGSVQTLRRLLWRLQRNHQGYRRLRLYRRKTGRNGLNRCIRRTRQPTADRYFSNVLPAASHR